MNLSMNARLWMIRIIGKVYPFKDKLAWSNTNGYFLIKKVIKFDTKIDL